MFKILLLITKKITTHSLRKYGMRNWFKISSIIFIGINCVMIGCQDILRHVICHTCKVTWCITRYDTCCDTRVKSRGVSHVMTHVMTHVLSHVVYHTLWNMLWHTCKVTWCITRYDTWCVTRYGICYDTYYVTRVI